jgi:all-trans-retinol 13,14-reductase
MQEDDMIDYDTIVIGSGAGGLTAAVALANAGQKVLVLEQHYVPGGWCHSFTLEGYRFSPGVHYIGELGPGGRMRAIYEGLGVSGDMDFLELNPDGYDHILCGKDRFDIPKGRDNFVERLKEKYPSESKGIEGYFNDIEKMCEELEKATRIRGAMDALTFPFKAKTLLRHGMTSLQSLLNRHLKNPVLKNVLSAQCGDYGLPPSAAPSILHALIATHYFDGAWYPRGGAYVMPRAFVRALKRKGGEIRLKASVEEILIEGKGNHRKVVGVRIKGGEEIRAKQVISNADPDITFGKLVNPTQISNRLKKKLKKTKYGISALSLFLALDHDPRVDGYDSGNYWYSDKPSLESTYAIDNAGPEMLDRGEFDGGFLTITTAKDPSKRRDGKHTVECFSMVPYQAFKQWQETRFEGRPDAYEACKKSLETAMLKTAEKIMPGISKHVVFSDLGTPLTNRHFVQATDGSLYGTEKSRFQIGPFAYPIRSEIPGLFLCGASTVGHGVAGATLSGLHAAKAILGCRMRAMLAQKGPALKTYLCDKPETWPKEIQPKTQEKVGVNG